MTAPVIRPGSDADLLAMQDIERSAGGLFRGLGMVEVADDEPASATELARYVDDGRAWVTLTTFTDVPWNGLYYRRLGFRPIPSDEITPGLRALREHEDQHGLDRWPRECLLLKLD